jgi:amino acid transporter
MWTREGIKRLSITRRRSSGFSFCWSAFRFRLRRKEPDVKRPFRVPLYPLTPLVFCLTSAYLLYSSLAYTGFGAFVGVGVLLVGALLLAALPTIDGFLQANQLRREKDEISTI